MTRRDTREKLLKEWASVNQEDGDVPTGGEHDQSNDGHGCKEQYVQLCKRPHGAREQNNHSADDKDRHKPNERFHDPPLTAYHWTSDYCSDLIPPKPTPNHKEKDRETEAND